MPGTTSINAINAIAIARGTSEPSNRNVLWLDENITGSFYKIIKSFNLESGTWELLSRSNLELLSDLKTVDGKGSGLDADTLHGLTPAELLGGEFSALPDLSIGQIIAGQSDTVGIAKTVGGVVTMDVDGNFAYVPNSISHTGLTDIGTNTHAQIDSKLASIDNIEGNLTNIGTLGASEDGYSIAWDNATSRFIPTAGVDSIYTADGALLGNRIIKGGGANSLSLGNNIASENLSYLKVNSIQGLEQFSSTFPFSNSGLEVTKNPGNFIGNLKSSASDYVKFQLTSDEFSVTSVLGTNNLTHISNSTLSRTIVSDTSGGTSSRLELNGSGGVNLGSTGSIGASIILDNINTFTDRNTTPKGLEYALDYSANYTDRSLVDKAFVLANAGGDSIYTADGALTGDRTVDLDGNVLSFEDSGNTGSISFKSVGRSVFKSVSASGNQLIFEAQDSTGSRIFEFFNNGDFVTPTFYAKENTGGSINFLNVGRSAFKGNNTASNQICLEAQDSTGSRIFEVRNNGNCIIAGNSFVSSENISLQKPTAIKGIGTAGSSALAIYDNDTTPNKLWDFLDNGNVNLGVTPTITANFNEITRFESSASNPYLTINANSVGNNSGLIFENNGSQKWFFRTDGTTFNFQFRNLATGNNPFEITSANVINLHECATTPKEVNVGGSLFVDGGQEMAHFKGTSNAFVNIDNASAVNGSSILFSTNGANKFITGYDGQYTGGFRVKNLGTAKTSFYITPTDEVILSKTSLPSVVGSEDISLQGSTLIKGIGTSGSSALSIYDNDTTPNKLWDFLDNGNINLGVDSVLNIGVNDLDVDGSGLFKASNGTRSIGVTSWNTHTYWGLNNGVKTWSLISANASGAYNQDEFSIGVTGFQPAFRAFEDSIGVGGLSKTNFDTSFSLHAGTNGIKSSGNIVAEDGIGGANKIELDFNNYPKVKITNGTNEYWLIEGDGTGSTFASGELYLYDATNARKLIHFLADGNIDFPNLPTSAPTKGMWNDGGTLKIA